MYVYVYNLVITCLVNEIKPAETSCYLDLIFQCHPISASQVHRNVWMTTGQIKSSRTLNTV